MKGLVSVTRDPQVSKRVHVGWRRARQRVRPVKAHDFATAWRARWRRRWRHSKRGSLGIQLRALECRQLFGVSAACRGQRGVG